MKYLKEILKWLGYKNKIGYSNKKELFDLNFGDGFKKWFIRKIGELYNVFV